MSNLVPFQPVDYLMIGHVTQDLTPQGPVLGGTASYAALTAAACGLRVGVVTSCRSDLDLGLLNGIPIKRRESVQNSTFINTQTPNGRVQHIRGAADDIRFEEIPEVWRKAPIVHLGPILHEIHPDLASQFTTSVLGITPQGWLREWDEDGLISSCKWKDAHRILQHGDIVVLSIEDIHGDEDLVNEYASMVPILVITEGAAGARVYWNGDVRTFRPPRMTEVDPVGAGDIFAASFFIRFHSTRDAWESARLATLVAANSVTRSTLDGVPTKEEVSRFMTEIIEMNTL